MEVRNPVNACFSARAFPPGLNELKSAKIWDFPAFPFYRKLFVSIWVSDIKQKIILGS
jgi:hypothetical protein